MIGIYKITNKLDGKIYIGQATNLERRINEHKQQRTQTIDNYINVLGVDNFDFEILEECSKEELDAKERDYIKKYNSQDNGYNIQHGGYNNSRGAGNGRALLTEEIVIEMRKAYANHESPSEFFEKIKDTGISKASFQAAWQGSSWSYIIPEVFTKENRNYYVRELARERSSAFTAEEVVRYRQYYVNHTGQEVYDLIVKEKGQDYVTLATVKKMLCGDGKRNNFYQQLPIYNKRKKQWLLNGEPVTTIPEPGE